MTVQVAAETPITPAKTSTIWTNFDASLVAHRSLIVALVFIAALVWGTDKLFTHIAQVDHNKAVADQALLAQTVQQNAQAATALKQESENLMQLFTQMSAQNAQLASAISTRNQQVVVQQKTDAALPPTQLASRWDSLLGTTGQVQSNAAGYAVSETAAVLTTQKLEEVSVLGRNVTDLETQNANKDQIITDGKKLVDDQKTQIAGLGTQITEADKACKAEITSVKAAARKSKLKWFGAGYLLGLASNGILKIFTGV